MATEEDVMNALRNCKDPEVDENVVDLGLVYGVEVKEGKADIRMTMTSPSCPYIPELLKNAQELVEAVEGISEVNIEVVWDPPWSADKISEEIKLRLGLDF